jgi:RHS repeat-associated protein
MKRLFCNLIVLALTASSAFAQYGPGWFDASLAPPLTLPSASKVTSNAASTGVPTPNYTGPVTVRPITGQAPIAEAITPEITALANNLENDPKRIYDYVHNYIHYVHYFGSKKGALMTLLEGSGNDFDQCALLAALLRAAGNNSGLAYTVKVQFGLMTMPYESTADNKDLMHWLGLTVPETGDNTYLNVINNLNYRRGYPFLYNNNLFSTLPNDNNDMIFHRVWLRFVDNNNNTYYLDPAFKLSTPVSGIDVAGSLGLNTSTFLTQAGSGATITSDYAQNLNWNNISSQLTGYTANLLGYLNNTAPNLSVEQVIGGAKIQESETQTFPGLPFAPIQAAYTDALGNSVNVPVLEWDNIPTSYMSTLQLQVDNVNVTYNFPALQARKVSLTFNTANPPQAVISLDDVANQTATSGSGATATMITSITHPFGNWNFANNAVTPVARFNQTDGGLTYQRTAPGYIVTYAFDNPNQLLKSRQQKLDALNQQGLSTTSTKVVTETLNVIGLSWIQQTYLASVAIGAQKGELVFDHHRCGRAAQELPTANQGGFYVDLRLNYSAGLWSAGAPGSSGDPGEPLFRYSTFISSALEHGILEQLQNNLSSSTIKLLYLANQNHQKLILATPNNASTVSSLLASETVSPYTAGDQSTLLGKIGTGVTMLLPSGYNKINTWKGYGYAIDSISGSGEGFGMIISGGYAGGYGGIPIWVDPVYQDTTSFINSPTIFTPAPVTQMPVTGADPVNMLDGSFALDKVDLAAGQPEPRGYSLGRHYDTNRRAFNQANMANGWTHRYNMYVSERSDAVAALGQNTPQEMAAFVAGVRAGYEIMNTTPTASNPQSELWAVAALISEWAVDNLKNNAVCITLGENPVQFIKQPDGSYTASAGVNMTLAKPSGYQLQQRRGNTFNFDPTTLKINSIVDPYGKTMSFTYSAGLLSTVVDGWGTAARTLTFHYNTANPPQLTSVSDGATADSTARTVTYNYATTYNPKGDLVSVVDPEGKTWAYVYDANHNITKTLDPTSPTPRTITQNIYDANFKVSQQYCQGDSVHQIWNLYTTPRVAVQKDPLGGRTIYYYDEKQRLVGVKDPNGNKTTTVYDGQDHAVQQISPLNETTAYVYDGYQNLLQVTDPLLNSAYYTYDPLNQYDQLTKKDFLGNVTSFTYDGHHQPQTITSPNVNNDNTKLVVVTLVYNPDGTLKTQQDPDLRVTSFQYDNRGEGSKKTYNNNDFESYTYNTLGDVINHTDAKSISTDFTYNHRRQPLTTTIHATGGDVAADVVTTLAYDNSGNLYTTKNPNGNTTSQTYSATQKPLLTTFPTVTAGTPTIQKTYDYRDWLQTITDPLSHNVNYVYDVGGRVRQTSDQLSHLTTQGYDNDGHRTSITSPLVAATQTTQFGYNARGEQITMTDAANTANSVVNYTYDNNGQLLTTKNRNGNIYTSTYYNDGHPWTFQTPSLNTTTYTYFQSGLLKSLTKPSTAQSTYTYDSRGRLWTSADPVGTSTYAYDADNNLLTHSENSKSITRVYDKLNRLTSYTDENGYVIGYVYDANGNLTQMTYPGNNIVKYKYDANNKLYQVTDWANRVTTFNRDLAGQILTIARPNGTVRTITYDSDGRTSSILEGTGSGAALSYNKLSYDEAGRITNEFAAPLPTPFTVAAETMTYDADNRIATFDGQTVVHDADGNMTSGPLNSSTPVGYTYDPRDRLTSVAAIGPAPALSYGYDSEGNRTSVTQAGQTTVYVVSPATGQVLMRIKSGVTTYYIYGEGLLYQVDTAGNTATYHYDSRGSTVALTDGSGNVTDRIEYSAYGVTTRRTGTTDTAFLYNGRYGVMTDANGLLFMRARYYNPYICRFINADPAGFGGGLNFYAFADGNPISETDPFGLDPWTQVMGGVRTIGGGLEAAAGYGLATAGAGVSTTGVGALLGVPAAALGVAIGAHGLDQVQAGARQAWSGNPVDSFTSQRLQAAGMSPRAANLTDAGISIAGSFGAGAATVGIRATQIAADSGGLANGMSTWQMLNTYETGAKALNSADYLALGGDLTSPLYKGLLMQQGVNLSGDAYQLTTGALEGFGQSLWLAPTGLTPLGYGGAGLGGAAAGAVDWLGNPTHASTSGSGK